MGRTCPVSGTLPAVGEPIVSMGHEAGLGARGPWCLRSRFPVGRIARMRCKGAGGTDLGSSPGREMLAAHKK